MFSSLGIGEIILIAGIALVIIGPERFPEFAKIAMRTIRDLRGYVNEVKDDLKREISPVKREIRELSRYNPEEYIDALTDAPLDTESEDLHGTPPLHAEESKAEGADAAEAADEDAGQPGPEEENLD